MIYMVVERFRDGQAEAVYRRAADHGRMLPEGLEYVDSWVSADIEQCFQLMQCSDERLLTNWMNRWSDLVEFEIVPVISSEEAEEKVLGRISGDAD